MRTITTGVVGVFVVAVFIAIGYAITTSVIFFLWNVVISPIFHFSQITAPQAFLINLGFIFLKGLFKSTESRN